MAINSYFDSQARSAVSRRVSSLVDGNVPGASFGDNNSLTLLRRITRQAVATHFKHGWQFRVEIPGAPAGWDLYCKESSHTPVELETDPKRVGAHVISYMTSVQPRTLSLTMRDDEDGRIFEWFEAWSRQVYNDDGTWNLPATYLKTVKLYNRLQGGGEKLRQELRVQPITMGELTESLDGNSGLLEFPITMGEFRGRGLRY